MRHAGNGVARYWTHERAIEALQREAARLRRTPTASDMKSRARACAPLATYCALFGSVVNAQRAAGLAPNAQYRSNRQWTRERAIVALQRLATQLGRTPRGDDLRRPAPSACVLQRLFGTLKGAQAAAGLVPNTQGGDRRRAVASGHSPAELAQYWNQPFPPMARSA
jgi:hypothetical protein